MSFLSHATLNQQTHHTPDAKTKTQLTKHDQPCSEPRQSTASVAHFHTTPRRRHCSWQDRLRFHSLFTLHLKIIPLQSYWLAAAAVTDLVCVCVFLARSQPTTLTLLHKHAAAAAGKHRNQFSSLAVLPPSRDSSVCWTSQNPAQHLKRKVRSRTFPADLLWRANKRRRQDEPLLVATGGRFSFGPSLPGSVVQSPSHHRGSLLPGAPWSRLG